MEALLFILLGIGFVFLMSRGHGGMGCCGGGHGNHRSETPDRRPTAPKAPAKPEDDVIDLREDEYTVIEGRADRYLPG